MLQSRAFLRVLKGPPLSVLLCLWLYGVCSQEEIKRRTGYDVKTVRSALDFLTDLSLVSRPHYRKWAIGDGVQQLPLARFMPANKKLSTGYPQDSAEVGNSPTSASETGNSPVSSNYYFTTTVVRQLQDAGINKPMCYELAGMPHVTEAYVAAHVAFGKKRKDAIGLVIHRMRAADPAPTNESVDYSDYSDVIVR